MDIRERFKMSKEKMNAVGKLMRSRAFILITKEEAVYYGNFKGVTKELVKIAIKNLIKGLKKQLADLDKPPKKGK